MALADRLKRLRGQAGPTDRASPEGQGAEDGVGSPRSLAERLRRVRVGRESVRPRTPDESALADALGAERIAPGVLRLTRQIAPRTRHGRALLGDGAGLDCLPWSLPGRGNGPSDSVLGPSPARAPGWLCLDTETSGLSGGTGTWAWLSGFLRAEESGWVLRQYLLARLDAEPDYLEAVAAELGTSARLVTYNGRAFDAPLLATRFRLAGRGDPLTALPHLDLLAPVRTAFARRWPDCRLATAESRLLGVCRLDDLPGAAAPAAWLGWLRGGETEALTRVLRHNRDDLLSLACLLPTLDLVYREPARWGADVRAVAAIHRRRGSPGQALAILAAHRQELDTPALLDLAGLYRRSGDWDKACAIWEDLAGAGHPEARSCLARYHEHRSGNLALALDLAEGLPPGPERERRRERLSAKLQRAGRDPDLGLALGD